MSALCQKRKSADYSITLSAATSNDWGTERPSGLEIDDQVELGRLHDWKIRRLFALKDATGVDAGLTIGVSQASAVADQAAGRDRFGDIKHRWQRVTSSLETIYSRWELKNGPEPTSNAPASR